MTNRKRGARTVVAAILVAIAVAAMLLVLLRDRSDGGEKRAQPNTTLSQTRDPVLTGTNVALLVDALASVDKTMQAKALVPELRHADWNASDVLPEGAQLTINQSSFRLDGESIGHVDADVTGSRSAKLIIRLGLVDGAWLIVSIEGR